MIIRNDDVAFDTFLQGDLRRFCELCDKHGLRILQGVTFRGSILPITDLQMTNETIRSFGANNTVLDCEPLIPYLRSRNDLIAVHGLWHTHVPTISEISNACSLLTDVGLTPTYFIPPFNEGTYPDEVCGLKVSTSNAQNVEHFLKSDLVPVTEIAYTHFWRYGRWYTWEELDKCLERIAKALK